MNKKLIRKMLTASGGPIYWLRKRLYNNIEPFGYNDVGSRLINAIVLNKNEHNNFKGDYSDIERAPALYLTIDNIWGEYLHIPEKERRYSNGKYKIKNNGNGTFSLPFESMEDIMQTVNSNNPLLWGLRGKLGNSVVGEYDVYRGYDKNGDYIKYIDHWRINPYYVKEDKEYGLDNNSLLKWYFKGKDDASFGLGTPVEIQGKYYLDDIYNVKGKDRGGHYLPEVIVTGKKKQGGKMNMLEFLKNGSGIHIKKKNRGSFTRWCGGNVTEECIRRGKASSNPKIRKKATFADNARHFKHRLGGILYFLLEGGNFLNSNTALINGIGAGILYFTTNNQLSKMLNEFNKSMKAKYNFLKNNINMKAINLLALQNIANLKLTNPEQNFGTIDLQLELERLRKEAAAEAEQLAKYLIALELSLFNNLINAIKGENTASLINGIFNIGKTALLNYKPKNNKTNIQTTTVLPKLTTNTYTSNYSLTTPSLGLFNTPLNNSLKFWNV